jgi:hypothetical protein
MRSIPMPSAATEDVIAAPGPSPTAGTPRCRPIWSAPTATTTVRWRGDTPAVEAVKVLARAHQSLNWACQRHVNALRSALREFYPGALAALGAQLAEPETLAVLKLAPTPEAGRQLTRARCGGRSSLRVGAATCRPRWWPSMMRWRRRSWPRRRPGRGPPALNLLAIGVNGGVMPASPTALAAAGLSLHQPGFQNSTALPEPRLGFLGDVSHPCLRAAQQRLQRRGRAHRPRDRLGVAPHLSVTTGSVLGPPTLVTGGRQPGLPRPGAGFPPPSRAVWCA